MLVLPLGENVLLSPEKKKETTESGIFIPDSAQEKQKIGEVIAVGESPKITIKKGQRVMYRQYAPSEYIGLIGKKECILINIADVLAVIED